MARRRTRRSLSVPERHELAIAHRTVRMHPVMAAVMGGPSPDEARRTIERLGPREPASSGSAFEWYVFDVVERRVVSGPFSTNSQAEKDRREMNISDDCIVVKKPKGQTGHFVVGPTPSLHDSKRNKGWRVPTISEIERSMPESYCLDDSRDAHNLSVTLSGRFTPSSEYRDGLYEALYDELYGKPWCTDNERERSKIATRVRIVLQRWVGK